MSEERRRRQIERGEQRKIAITMRETAGGDYELIEHDLTGRQREDRIVACFYKEKRVVTVKGEFGPDLATQDMAHIRAKVFADFFEALVNSGKIDFG